MQHEITKITKIREINNEMAHNFYMCVNGRTYNDEHKRYYAWHFIEWFDIFDLQEWFEDEHGENYGGINNEIKIHFEQKGNGGCKETLRLYRMVYLP